MKLPKIVDAANASDLHRQAYTIFCAHRDTPWQFSTFEKSLQVPHSIIVNVDDKCVAYAAVSEVLGEFEIQDISVSGDYTGQGIAHAMLRHIVATATDLGGRCILLEVARQNIHAQALYEKHGFLLTAIRKNYYSLPNQCFDDALLMRKSL